jgi:metallo-beta-lactamase class B
MAKNDFSRFTFACTVGTVAATVAFAQSMVASEATIAAHVGEAMRAAGNDLKQLTVLCKPPVIPQSGEAGDRFLAALIAKPAPEPGQAFDNLYYVGSAWVSAWVLKTSDGLILIDALNNEQEAATLIEGGMAKFGLDPKQIRYLIVTHGHGDHYGGANYIVERYHPRVVMGAIDWTMTETKLDFASKMWGPPPRRDIAVNDGDSITLGDAKVNMYLTPGHTLGTISPVFEVKAGGKSHRAMLWGGTAFNFGKNIPRMGNYIDSTARMTKIAQEQGVDVFLSNHPSYDDTVSKLDTIRRQGSLAPDPFVMGVDSVVRALTVMGACATANRDRYLLEH